MRTHNSENTVVWVNGVEITGFTDSASHKIGADGNKTNQTRVEELENRTIYEQFVNGQEPCTLKIRGIK